MPEPIDRRRFLMYTGSLLLGGAGGGAMPGAAAATRMGTMAQVMDKSAPGTRDLTLFLCGDVMTGRGIDQVLPHPGDPALHEPYVTSALDYVALAERASGPIRRPVDSAYIWGDALVEWARIAPDLRLVNLETAVTTRDDLQRGKGIHYRMHPANMPCLTAAGIDCCVLANNHVLDWGYAGLAETLETLHRAKVQTAGGGRDQAEAAAPAALPVAGKARVLVFSFGTASSGIPPTNPSSRGPEARGDPVVIKSKPSGLPHKGTPTCYGLKPMQDRMPRFARNDRIGTCSGFP